MPLDRVKASALLPWNLPHAMSANEWLDALEECVTPDPDGAPGILLNRDEAHTARACIVFREVMGRNPGTAPVLALAARLDAYLFPNP